MRLARPARLDRYEADGWLPMVAARDSASAVWVLFREDDARMTLTDLLAVVVADVTSGVTALGAALYVGGRIVYPFS